MPQSVFRLQGYAALEQRAIDPSLRLFAPTGDPKCPERELALAEAMGLVERRSTAVAGIFAWVVAPPEPKVRD